MELPTTKGPIIIPKDLQNGWTLLYYYAGDFLGISATELMELAELAGELARIDCRILCISADSIAVHLAFLEQLSRLRGSPLPFPLASDRDGSLRRQWQRSEGQKHLWLIAPDGEPRAYFCYPEEIGANFSEGYRTLRALQTKRSTPCGWVPGDYLLAEPPQTARQQQLQMQACEQRGGIALDWYLCYEAE